MRTGWLLLESGATLAVAVPFKPAALLVDHIAWRFVARQRYRIINGTQSSIAINRHQLS